MDKFTVFYNKPDYAFVIDDKLVIVVHIETLFFKIHILEGMQTQNNFIDRMTSKIFGDKYRGKVYSNYFTWLL